MKKSAFQIFVTASSSKKFSLLCLILFIGMAKTVFAEDTGLFARGAIEIIVAPLEIPRQIILDSTQHVFPFGILTGVLSGSVKAVSRTFCGVKAMARSGAPYAKYFFL